MFTGIIEELGLVRRLSHINNGVRLGIESTVCGFDATTGDSISVNGACLTLTDKERNVLFFDVSKETLNTSNLEELTAGNRVNLERSLKQGGRIGGHFVTGHVDCVAKVISKASNGDFIEFKVSMPTQFRPFLAEKGSIAVDGISLTVNSVSGGSFDFMVIPHTLSNTTLKLKEKGSSLNIETDILAKYTQNLIVKTESMPALKPRMDRDFFTKHGFA